MLIKTHHQQTTAYRSALYILLAYQNSVFSWEKVAGQNVKVAGNFVGGWHLLTRMGYVLTLMFGVFLAGELSGIPVSRPSGVVGLAGMLVA